MKRIDCNFILCLSVACILWLPAAIQATEIAVRFGQGGFRDSRAPEGVIGGGQLCLDLTANDYPLVISIGTEYYTTGSHATHAYEISSLFMCSLGYTKTLFEKWSTKGYLGGGVGRLEIPQGDKALAFEAITRIDTKLFWKIHGYAEGKYIFSKKRKIDFNEAAVLLGIALKLNL